MHVRQLKMIAIIERKSQGACVYIPIQCLLVVALFVVFFGCLKLL